MLRAPTMRRLALPHAPAEIALLDWGGSGPLALLHHANGFCAALWAPVAKRLCEAFHVVALDARGHGHSTKLPTADDYAWPAFGEDAAFVARTLAAEHRDGKVALALGHSFGGTSLLMAAAAAPDLFDRLVLADPVLPPPPTVGAAKPERLRRGRELAEKAKNRREVFESREHARKLWSEKSLFQSWEPLAFDLYLQEGFEDLPDGRVRLRCPTFVEAAIFANGSRIDAWALASQVDRPTLLLWAERGDFPRAMIEAVAARMRAATLENVATSHFVPMEDSALVADRVIAFAS